MSLISETGLSLSPYPGLRPFRRDEADIFFGREEQVDQLLGKLETCRFLTVVGASGCGKSSLVRAGMLSALEGGFMASAGPRWHVVEMRPGGHPLVNLSQSLLSGNLLSGQWRNRPDAEAFVCAVLKRGPLGLVELLKEERRESRVESRETPSSRPPVPDSSLSTLDSGLSTHSKNLLLLVDQFEEIFRFHKHGDAGEATAFVDLLLHSARQADLPIYVVLTMRSDFLGDCSIFADLPEAINDGQFLIPRLSREQCRAAVVGPAAAFGATVQPELVNHVLNDIGSNPDQLPLMQHALMRVWNGAVDTTVGRPRRTDETDEVTLTLADYEAAGGLKNALSNHADELFGSLSENDQRIAQVLFRCLSERGADGRDIRRPVPLHAVADVAQVPAETIIRIVDVFREPTCSFLTPPAPIPLQSDTVLDISHESLIRQWHRMAAWVQTEADSAAIFRRLSETALLWKRQSAALWITPDLENALAWRDRERPNAVWAQRYGGSFRESMAFLDASIEAHERSERQEKVRQERERELLQNMARAEKQRADDAEGRRKDQARANALLKRRAITAAGAGIASILLAVVAFVLYAQARSEKERADEARNDAEVARKRADELARKEAGARQRSEKAELAALDASNSAYQNLGKANVAQLRSLWNSTEPGRQQKALGLLLESSKIRNIALMAGSRQSRAQRQSFESFWRQLTPQLREQAVRWLSLTSLQQIRGIPFTLTNSSSTSRPSFALSPVGNRVAVFRQDTRELQIMDVVTGNVSSSVKISPGNRTLSVDLGFADDGKVLLVALGGSTAPVVERRSAADLTVKQTIKLDVAGWTRSTSYSYGEREDRWFDEGGRYLAYSGRSGAAVWDVASGKRLYTGDGKERVARFTRIRDTIAVVRNAKSTALVSLNDGSTLKTVPLNEGSSTIRGATLAPAGDWLALELNYRYTSSGAYELPLLIVNTATGETVSRVNLSSSRSSYSSARFLDVAFHPRRPVLAVLDSQYVSLISVPQGGILYQVRAADTPDAERRRFTAEQIEFNRNGDLLMTALRDSTYYSSSSGIRPMALLQLWDPSVATASLQTLALEGSVHDFTFVGDDALAVAGGDRNRTGVQVRPLKGTQPWATTSASPSGGYEPSGKHYVHVLPNQFDVLDAGTGRRVASIDRRWPGYGNPLPVANAHQWILGVDRSGKSPKLRLFDATGRKWGTELLDSEKTLNAAVFSDDGRYIAVTSYDPSTTPGKSPGGSRYRTVVVATADGAKVFESPKNYNDMRITRSGHLLTREYSNNDYIFEAHDFKSGRRVSEHRISSSGYTVSLSYGFYLNADETIGAFRHRGNSSNAQIYVWPFAEGKDAEALSLTLVDYYNVSINVFNDRLLCSGLVPASTPKSKKGKASKSLPQRYMASLWDLKTRRQLKNWGNRPNLGVSYQASPQYGKALLYWSQVSANMKTGVWNLKDATKVADVNGYPRGISPDGRFAVFSKGEVLDLSSNKLRPSPNGVLITSFHFSPDSRYLVTRRTSGDDSTLGILNLKDPNAPWKLDTSLKKVFQAAVSPDGRLLMAYSYNTPHLIHLWDLRTGAKRGTASIRGGNFRPDVDTVSRLTVFQFSPQGRHYAVVSHDQLRLGNTGDKQVHTELPRSGHRLVVHSVAVSPDRRFVASASADQTVCFWDAKDGRYLGMLEDGGNSSIRNVVFSPNGNLVATRKENGEIALWKWSRPTGPDGDIAAIFLWSNARGEGRPLAFAPDGTQLASGDSDGGIRIFDAATGRMLQWLQPRGAAGGLRGLSFSPDGRQLAASRGHVIALWDVRKGTMTRAWDARQGEVFELAYPRDGRFLISTGRDVRIWDPQTATVQLALDKNTAAVRHVAVSDSGDRLAFGVDDRSVVITNVTELLKSIEKLGLKMSPGAGSATDAGTAWKQPLWTPAAAKDIASENTLAEFLPKAFAAERDQDWKQAAANLSKLIEMDPENQGYRKRRFTANSYLKLWKTVAEDGSKLLDAMPANEYRTSPRSVWLLETLRKYPDLYAELEKARPKDPLLPIVRGRDLALRDKWKEACEAYGKLIRHAQVHENAYEYAALCLIAGKRKEYDEHLAWMAAQKGEPKDDFNAYAFSRAAALVPSKLQQEKAIDWADAAVGKHRYSYYLHAAALAYYRAGRFDQAKRLLAESMKSGWVPPLNQLLLGLVEYRAGNFDEAKALLEKVQAWRKQVHATRTEGLANVLVPDWVEVQVLLPELEALIAKGPLPERKPVDAPRPKSSAAGR